MIKLLEARYLGAERIELMFSGGKRGVFDVRAYRSARQGSLLEPLRNEAYLKRFFIDAGALCWPNGLELSPARLHEISVSEVIALD